jgi:hypothetical protein
MFGREELESLALQKRALVLESGLNRVALQGEVQRLRASTSWAGGLTRGLTRGLTPLLTVLAPLAGVIVARGLTGRRSWLGRLMTVAKWGAPLYRLWKGFARGRAAGAAGRFGG